jgi:molybdopterin molybdotransferase
MIDVVSIEEALRVVQSHIYPIGRMESVPLSEASGRVLAETIAAGAPVPAFTRSTVDGYAVRAADTYGASEAIPALLTPAGEVLMGETTSLAVSLTRAVAVPTGGMLPAGADAVVMVEYTEILDDGSLAVYRGVAPGENVISPGDDIAPGCLVAEEGDLLHPARLGALAAVGHAQVMVYARPVVTIYSTGNEVVPVEVDPPPGKVRDINSYTTAGVVAESGGVPVIGGIVADDEPALRAALTQALAASDAVVLSGGSSVGVKDLTEKVLSSLGEPGLLVHGLAIKPGKPTLLAVVNGKPVIGLPGHPLSSLVVADAVLGPIVASLARRSSPARARVMARFGRNLASAGGRREYVPVTLKTIDGALWADPVLSTSAAISSMASADGWIVVGEYSEGVRRGQEVAVVVREEGSR